MKLIFIRHGDPDYVRDSLTEKGWREAKLLAKRMAKVKMDYVYVSPLGRAQDTCNETLKLTGGSATTLDWLAEFYVPIDDPVTGNKRIPWDFYPGYWTKHPELYDKDNWVDSEIMATGPVKEQYEKVINGMDALLKEHGYEREGNYYKVLKGNEDTLVFYCHLGLEFLILSHLLGLAAPVLWQQFFVAPTSVTIVCTEERVQGEACFRVKQLGDTSHLYIGGEEASNSGFFMETYRE